VTARKPAAKSASKATAKKSAPATKTTRASTTAKKAPAKKGAAKKPAARKTTTKTTAKKATAKKAPARKPAGSKSSRPTSARKKATSGTASTRISAAGKSLGEQVYRRVEEVVATGKTAKAAFDVVARERKMSVSNVQQHYYRFKRKAQTGAKSRAKRAAGTRAGKAVSRTQATALTAVATAGSVLPAKQIAAIGKDLQALGKDLQKASKGVRGHSATLGNDTVRLLGELLEEARKNKRFRNLEKNITQLLLLR
jgi:hypothetical protein